MGFFFPVFIWTMTVIISVPELIITVCCILIRLSRL